MSTPIETVPATSSFRYALIQIGACSWAYPEWVGPFYARGVRQADFLSSYAQRFGAVEVDSTFYSSPNPKTAAAWRAKTPREFRFCLKVPQAITHEKMLSDCDSEVSQFADAVRALENKLQCCVLQFPFFNRAAFASLGDFLSRLSAFLTNWPADIPLAVEVRNSEWMTPSLAECLRRHRCAWVMADIVSMPAPAHVIQELDVVTGSFAYVRLIGHRAEVEALTKTFDRIVVDRSERIQSVAEGIRSLASRVPVLAFVNNHYAGYAPETIRQLEQALGIEPSVSEGEWFFGGRG